ncbi:MAG: hypothetical protein ACKODX_21060, partial [Gemmata sp.]
MSAAPPRASLVALLIALAGTPPAPAQPPEKRPLAVEDLYKLDAPRDAALAPDGKALVYSRQWIDAKDKLERFALWRVAGDRAKREPVEAGQPDGRAPVFSPDGKWI